MARVDEGSYSLPATHTPTNAVNHAFLYSPATQHRYSFPVSLRIGVGLGCWLGCRGGMPGWSHIRCDAVKVQIHVPRKPVHYFEQVDGLLSAEANLALCP